MVLFNLKLSQMPLQREIRVFFHFPFSGWALWFVDCIFWVWEEQSNTDKAIWFQSNISNTTPDIQFSNFRHPIDFFPHFHQQSIFLFSPFWDTNMFILFFIRLEFPEDRRGRGGRTRTTDDNRRHTMTNDMLLYAQQNQQHRSMDLEVGERVILLNWF